MAAIVRLSEADCIDVTWVNQHGEKSHLYLVSAGQSLAGKWQIATAAVSPSLQKLHSLSNQKDCFTQACQRGTAAPLFLPILRSSKVMLGFWSHGKISMDLLMFYTLGMSTQSKYSCKPAATSLKISIICKKACLKAEQTWSLGGGGVTQNREPLASKSSNENASRNNPKPFPLNLHCHYRSISWKKMMVPAGQDQAGGVENSSTNPTTPTFNRS